MPTTIQRTFLQESLPFEVLECQDQLSVVEIIVDEYTTDYWFESGNGDYNRIRIMKDESSGRILGVDRFDPKRNVISSSRFALIEGTVWELRSDRVAINLIEYASVKKCIRVIDKEIYKTPLFSNLPASTHFDRTMLVFQKLIGLIKSFREYNYNNSKEIIDEIVEHMQLGDIDKWVLDRGVIEIISLLRVL